jgi:hypothetical protein
LLRPEWAIGAGQGITHGEGNAAGTPCDSCIKVAVGSGTVHVRGPKDRQGPQLAFSHEEWAGFVAFVHEASAR